MLCQLTADVCARPVIAGPAEATAMGNLLVQASAAGEVSGLDEIRGVVRNSVELATYEPRESAAWREASGRFEALRRIALDA